MMYTPSIRKVIGALIFVAAVFATSSAVAASKLYEEFAEPSLNGNRWQQPSTFALIANRKLNLACGSVASKKGTTLSKLASTTTGTQYQTKLSIKDITMSGAQTSFVGVSAIYYSTPNSSTINNNIGDVIATVYFGDRGNGLEAWWHMAESDDNGLETVINETTGVIVAPGALQENVEYIARLAYNGSNSVTFGFNGVSITQTGPAFGSLTQQPAMQLQCGQSHADTSGSPLLGEMSAEFDDFMLNGSLYDDFASALIDSNKWKTSNRAAYVQGDHATILVVGDVTLGQGDRVQHTLSLKPEFADTNYLRATFTIKSESAIPPGGNGSIEIGGVWYNDTYQHASMPNGEEGNVFAKLAIEKRDGVYRAFAQILRSNNSDSSDVTELDFHVFDMPIFSETEYTLGIVSPRYPIGNNEGLSFSLREKNGQSESHGYSVDTSVIPVPHGFGSKSIVTTVANSPGSIWIDVDHICIDDTDDSLVGYLCPEALPPKLEPWLPSTREGGSQPTYFWKTSAYSSFYLLQVFDSVDNLIHEEWVSSFAGLCEDAPTYEFCQYKPLNHPSLDLGESATWYITGWNIQYGLGPRSDPMPFTVTCTEAPGTLTLQGANPDIADNLPDFIWGHDNRARDYVINIFDDAGEPVQSQSISASRAGCLDDGVCSSELSGYFHPYTDPLLLANYTVYIAGRNACGYGPTTSHSFERVCASKPSGRLDGIPSFGFFASTNPPTYTWRHDPDVLYYYLYVADKEGRVVEQRWIDYKDICEQATPRSFNICQSQGTVPLADGWSSLYVFSYNQCGLADEFDGSGVFLGEYP